MMSAEISTSCRWERAIESSRMFFGNMTHGEIDVITRFDEKSSFGLHNWVFLNSDFHSSDPARGKLLAYDCFD